MSKRHRLSRTQASAQALFGPLDGARIPGGCESCDAYQVVRPAVAGVWHIDVRHDDDCPFLAAHEASR